MGSGRLLQPLARAGALAGLLAACSSASTTTATTAPSVPAGRLGPSCGAAGAAAPEWPQAVPASLPKPPGSAISSVRLIGAATYVVFTTPTSLRSSTLYLVSSLTHAGYTLARGDAEATEADAPFVGESVVGAIRLTLTENCLTTWTLAVEPRTAAVPGAAPSLIPYHPGASARPLPFG